MSIYIGDKLVANALDHKLKMNKTNPEGTGSLSINRKSGTTIGTKSVAMGHNNEASGNYSIAIGYGNKATLGASVAIGTNNIASGNRAVALGNVNTASGAASFAEGAATEASGARSHAEGYYTIAAGENQHVSGKYNIEDTNNTYAVIVGNGTTENNRSNAYTLDWNGNAKYAGTVQSSSGVLISDQDLTIQLNRLGPVNEADTYYTTYMARGEALYASSSSSVPTVNGTIAWYYS